MIGRQAGATRIGLLTTGLPTIAASLLVAAGAVVAGSSGQAAAQAFPTKQIRVIVPLSAGSATDIIPRVVFEHVGQALGQSIIVENRVGAGGTIGANAVAKSDPDGHTILVHSNAHVISPAVMVKLPYDVEQDFHGVTSLGIVPHVLVIATEKNIKTIKELVAAVKTRPGGLLYAAVAATAPHLNAEHFKKSMQIEGRMVPFKGAPEALTEVLAGRVDVYFSPILPALPFIEGKKMLPLAVTAAKRVSALPDVPTAMEQGYADAVFGLWIGMYVPVKTPRAVIDKLYAETAKALQKAEVSAKLKQMGVEPNLMTPTVFDAYIKKEIAVSAELAKVAGLSKQ